MTNTTRPCAAHDCTNTDTTSSPANGMTLTFCRSHMDAYQVMNALQAATRQTYRYDFTVIADYPGFVYVLEFEGPGPLEGKVKIGMARDYTTLVNRLTSHKAEYPAPFEVLAIYKGGAAVEHWIHRELIPERAQYTNRKHKEECEIFWWGPELFEAMGELDAAGCRAWDVQPEFMR